MANREVLNFVIKEKSKPGPKKIAIAKEVIQRAVGKIRISDIVVTPFEVLDKYVQCPDYNTNVTKEDYMFINSKLLAPLLPTLSGRALRILSYIWFILRPNSNVVNFTMRNIYSMYGISENTNIVSNVGELERVNLVRRTNKIGYYIINHNIFFKGNLNKFADKYRELYSLTDIYVDSMGGIVIDTNKGKNYHNVKRMENVISLKDFEKENTIKVCKDANLIGGKPVFATYSPR